MKEFKINYHYLNECDMKCKFCFGKMNKKFDKDQVIETFESICKVTNTVNLAGGEIFLYLDLLKSLVSTAVKNRVQVSLISNGYILTNNLDDERVDYIVENVKLIGISIDSFVSDTNNYTGRNCKGKSVSQKNMIKLREKCYKYRTKLKINTVITQSNFNEEIGKKIQTIAPDKWKVIQVVSEDQSVLVSNDEFNSFISNNKLDNKIDIEYAKSMRKSYIMINNEGTLYYDAKHIDSININSIVNSCEKNYSTEFYKALKVNNIDLDLYYSRYNSTENEVCFNKAKYSKSFKRLLEKTQGNILFLDVESITPRYKGSTCKYMKYTSTQLHCLYTGLILNKNLEIIDQVSDCLPLGINLIDNLDSNSDTYKEFYRKFFSLVKKNKIHKILVSGIDTERNFLEDCIYYLSSVLKRKDYEKIQHLLNSLVDIHKIKDNQIVSTYNNSSASRNLLNDLNEFRPDLFLYTRKEYKSSESSFDICKLLIDIYLVNEKHNDTFLQKCIEMIKDYCMDDVYDDFELVYIYEGLMKTSINSRRKDI